MSADAGDQKRSRPQQQQDWFCKTCQFKVFGSKPCCSKCGAKPPSSSSSSSASSSSADWICASCSTNNFARRDKCFKCNQSRHDRRQQQQEKKDTNDVADDKQKKKPGDWDCKKCGTLNFAKRDACFKCKTNKDAELPCREETKNNNKDGVENVCKVCYDAALEVCIQPCGHVALCTSCVQTLPNPPLCPVCRGAIEDTTRIYFA